MRKRRKPGERPVWAPAIVDVAVSAIHPRPGWAVVEELFPHEVRAGLEIIGEYRHNTVFGRVLRLHESDAKRLDIGEGCVVAFREWSGGRWLFNGCPALVTGVDNILAVVMEVPDGIFV